MTQQYIPADLYPWPYNGDLRPEDTALVVIDMQIDVCGIGGYVDRMGYDLSLTRDGTNGLFAINGRSTTSRTVSAFYGDCFGKRLSELPASGLLDLPASALSPSRSDVPATGTREPELAVDIAARQVA